MAGEPCPSAIFFKEDSRYRQVSYTFYYEIKPNGMNQICEKLIPKKLVGTDQNNCGLPATFIENPFRFCFVFAKEKKAHHSNTQQCQISYP